MWLCFPVWMTARLGPQIEFHLRLLEPAHVFFDIVQRHADGQISIGRLETRDGLREEIFIDPATGNVEGSINLQGLLPVMQRPADMNPSDDVLNGIARNPADGGIWVTGKNWPRLYRIELVPAAAPSPASAESR